MNEIIAWVLTIYGLLFVGILFIAFLSRSRVVEREAFVGDLPRAPEHDFDAWIEKERHRDSDPLHEDDWLGWGTGENR